MADELKYGEIKTQYKKLVASSQVMVDFNVESKDGKRITKILSIVTDPKVTAVDALNGECVINGRVNYKILYLNEDNEIVSLDYFSDYKDKISAKEVLPNSRLTVNTDIVDITINEDGIISISLVIENNVYAITQEALPVLKAVPDNYFDERRTITVQNYADTVKSLAEVVEEASADGTVGRILMFDTTAIIDKVSAGNGIITVEGTLFANVLYTYSDGNYENKQITVPFTEEQPAPAGTTLQVFSEAEIKTSKVVLAGTEDNNIIRIEAAIEIASTVIANLEEEVVADVFSITHEINTHTEKLVADKYYDSVSFGENVGGTINLEDNMPAINNILGYLGARNNIASLKSSADKAVVEGILSLTVLYRDSEETVNSVGVEIPYSVNIKDSAIFGDFTLEGKGKAGIINVKRRRDRELEVLAELHFNIRAYGKDTAQVISEVEELEAKAVNGSAVSIYNTGEGETLWDIAKALSCTPDAVLQQNEDLVFPVKNPGRVMLYRVLE
ncbi:MAG: DUF3794 domain-containing protein [Clostridiales bacterium]|jgi:hypothetical protein|nr:DUF3794 domain-containing protein [Clostridiales bacterium]